MKDMMIPENKIGKLRDNSLYFWMVSNPSWRNGQKQRIRLKYKRAIDLNKTVNYSVTWAISQEIPKGGAPGSQKALVYGSSTKESKKARGRFHTN